MELVWSTVSDEKMERNEVEMLGKGFSTEFCRLARSMDLF